MPNYCSNRIAVLGEKDLLEQFRSAVRGPDDVDCLPSPGQAAQMLSRKSAHERLALLRTAPRRRLTLSKRFGCDLSAASDEQLAAFAETPRNLIEEVSFSFPQILPLDPNERLGLSNDSADVRTALWGTKWGPGESEIGLEVEDKRLLYSFSSPWSPPCGVVERLIAQWPNLRIALLWVEIGNDHCGAIWTGAGGEAEVQETDCTSVMRSSDQDYETWSENFIMDRLAARHLPFDGARPADPEVES